MLHEAWLENYPTQGENHTWYRLSLGDLIDASKRKTFTPNQQPGAAIYTPDLHTQSGSIAFMDITIREQRIPKVDAQPISNLNDIGDYRIEDYERLPTLTIGTVGIEPDFRGDLNYVRKLHERALELAREWGLSTIVLEGIQNPKLKRILPRLGYTVYYGPCAVRRLA